MSEVNKVVYGDKTLIDLTSDTVNENAVLEGHSFHSSDGTLKEGKVVTAEVVDNLTSTSKQDALSANQGRVLNEEYNSIKNKVVKYYDNPQDYYDLSEAEREAMDELVILNDDGDPLDASLIAYKDSTLEAGLTNIEEQISTLNSSLDSMGTVSYISFEDNSATFELKQPNKFLRYTAILALCNQDTSFLGLYVIGVNNEKVTFSPVAARIDSVDASKVNITRSGNLVTIEFPSVGSIWSRGVLVVPKMPDL